MTRLSWNAEISKFETGVDHAVFYPTIGNGVAWSGILSVEQSFTGGDVTSYYFDGIKYMDTIDAKIYQASVSTLTTPQLFRACVGEKSVVPGMILTRQPKTRFGFSYRTDIGSDATAYKIHLVYNALASSSNRTYNTVDNTGIPASSTWEITATPTRSLSSMHKPSAHIILESLKLEASGVLEQVESILYGSTTTEPRLPTLDEIIALYV